MTPETIERTVLELKERYCGATVARDGRLTLVKLPEVHFPNGCQPPISEAMVGLDPSKAKPDLYLKVIPSVPNQGQPSYGAAIVGGNSWCTFSFNLQWDEAKHTAVQFVEGMLRRFARHG